MRGINFLVAVIGLFGISEILLTMEERLALRGHAAGISLRVVLAVWKDLPKYWVTLLRSSFIGCWLGITPGGAIAASFMGYNLAKRFSKDPDSFGKGRIEGVFAPETAAHASGTAALLPMLALGIPGSGTAAILLGGLMVWGLNPGPLLFVEHKDFVWGLIASMYLGNVVGLVLVLTTVPIFASILRVPFAAVAPMIVVSCAIGAYAIQNAMFDIWLMLGFGVVGYVFKKIGIPLAPFTLALVLGNRAEDAFRLSMIGSGGDMKVFWSNGLVGSITTLAIVLLFWPVIDKAFGGVERACCGRRRRGLADSLLRHRRHTTLRCRSSAISSLPKPNSASTSSVCSPNSGGRAAILLGVRDSVTGWPTSRIWRFSSLGTCWAMPRCLTWASSNIWSIE